MPETKYVVIFGDGARQYFS